MSESAARIFAQYTKQSENNLLRAERIAAPRTIRTSSANSADGPTRTKMRTKMIVERNRMQRLADDDVVMMKPLGRELRVVSSNKTVIAQSRTTVVCQ